MLIQKPMDWRHGFKAQGYVRFAGLMPQPLVLAALTAIDRDIRENFSPERQLEYDNRSYCPDLLGTPPIMNLLEESPVSSILDQVLGIDHVEWDGGQIAIRRAHQHSGPYLPPPHLDGFANDLNGLDGGMIHSFTALVGIFLTPVRHLFAGNLTVWPRSHSAYARYFRKRGKRAMGEQMPSLQIGEPTQLMCEAGDVVICHYLLGHTAAPNMGGIDRIAVYFRISLRGLEERRWHYLVKHWDRWKL